MPRAKAFGVWSYFSMISMPFFMEYETVCGKKERYNKIVDRMEDEASAGFADAKARNAYLAALVLSLIHI